MWARHDRDNLRNSPQHTSRGGCFVEEVGCLHRQARTCACRLSIYTCVYLSTCRTVVAPLLTGARFALCPAAVFEGQSDSEVIVGAASDLSRVKGSPHTSKVTAPAESPAVGRGGTAAADDDAGDLAEGHFRGMERCSLRTGSVLLWDACKAAGESTLAAFQRLLSVSRSTSLPVGRRASLSSVRPGFGLDCIGHLYTLEGREGRDARDGISGRGFRAKVVAAGERVRGEGEHDATPHLLLKHHVMNHKPASPVSATPSGRQAAQNAPRSMVDASRALGLVYWVGH